MGRTVAADQLSAVRSVLQVPAMGKVCGSRFSCWDLQAATHVLRPWGRCGAVHAAMAEV